MSSSLHVSRQKSNQDLVPYKVSFDEEENQKEVFREEVQLYAVIISSWSRV